MAGTRELVEDWGLGLVSAELGEEPRGVMSGMASRGRALRLAMG